MISRREPSAESATSAVFEGGAAATTSVAKFTRRLRKPTEMLVTNLIKMRQGTGWHLPKPLLRYRARRGHARRVARGTQVVGANLLPEARKLFQREPVS